MGCRLWGCTESDTTEVTATAAAAAAAAGKTTRSLWYDLDQIPDDYAVELRNRFKGLDQIECLMNYGDRFGTLCRRQGARPSPRKRNAKKQNGYLRGPYK